MSQYPPPLYGQPIPPAPGMANYYVTPGNDAWPGLMRFLTLVLAVAAGIAALTHGGPLLYALVSGEKMFPRGASRVVGLGPEWWYLSFLWLRAALDVVWVVGAILLLARKPAASIVLLIYCVAILGLSAVNAAMGMVTYLDGTFYGRSTRAVMLASEKLGAFLIGAALPVLIMYLITRPRTASYLRAQA